ncbi:MAG: glycosyl transferase family 1 [Deltaproteobacteria bacterium]|nr:glycosyl transferase family 1 [Deltaproteobacteria bacterium]
MTQPRRKKVLFFAEDFSLAHVGRALHLAEALDSARFDVAIACGERYQSFVEAAGIRRVDAFSVGSEEMLQSLADGTPLFTSERLKRYVDDDLRLLNHETPDLIVSDFRVSLGISAPLLGIPLATLVNAHWSPYSKLRPPMPEHPILNRFGVTLGTALFNLVRPFAFRQHARAFRELQESYGLSATKGLHEMYSAGTWTMYADVPVLSPCAPLPDNHSYLGPITWEPPVPLPAWWEQVPANRPVIYCSVGSSGDPTMIEATIAGLTKVDASVIMATAGHQIGCALPENFFTAQYLPGDACVRRSSLVICNGGAGAVYQALRRGKPFIGVPSNLDQYLVMRGVTQANAGLQIRAGKLNAKRIESAVSRHLDNPSTTPSAANLEAEIASYDVQQRFAAKVEEWLSGHKSDAHETLPAAVPRDEAMITPLTPALASTSSPEA